MKRVSPEWLSWALCDVAVMAIAFYVLMKSMGLW